MLDHLVLPVPEDLKLVVACDGFDAWWGMWLSHVFKCPLAPMLQQIDADHEVSDSEVPVFVLCFSPPSSPT